MEVSYVEELNGVADGEEVQDSFEGCDVMKMGFIKIYVKWSTKDKQ